MAQQTGPQRVDLYQPMVTERGPAPLALRVGVKNPNSISEGVPSNVVKIETYVLLSALPTELRNRVELAIQALIAGR
jgi:hypothetical protein